MAITFSKPALIKWSGTAISDHNRQPMGVTFERIESSSRMANGTMRKYVVADKRSFDLSWTELPNLTTKTVDGFWGKNAMETFYKSTVGSFVMSLSYGNGTVETVTVMFTDFSATLGKRGTYDFWDVNVTLEEV